VSSTTSGQNNLIKGTWEYNGKYSVQKITSGKTPYKTYFSVVKEIISNTNNTARVTAYADSNNNGTFDASDLLIGDAITKTYNAGTLGSKGTFEGSLNSNIVYSYVSGKKVGEATYDKSLWSTSQSQSTSNASTQAGPSKDPVTGQKLIFSDLGTIQSDKVYGKENSRWLQPIATNLGFTKKEMDSLKGFNIEFEFSNQYIAVTTQVKGDTRSQYNLPATYGPNWTARWVLKGDFAYDNGKLTSAVLKEGAFQVVSQSKQYEGGSATSFYSSATVQDLGKFSSIKAAANYAGNGGTPPGLTTNFYPVSGSQSNSSVQSWVKQFGDERFFYSGWETNPFASNLI